MHLFFTNKTKEFDFCTVENPTDYRRLDVLYAETLHRARIRSLTRSIVAQLILMAPLELNVHRRLVPVTVLCCTLKSHPQYRLRTRHKNWPPSLSRTWAEPDPRHVLDTCTETCASPPNFSREKVDTWATGPTSASTALYHTGKGSGAAFDAGGQWLATERKARPRLSLQQW